MQDDDLTKKDTGWFKSITDFIGLTESEQEKEYQRELNYIEQKLDESPSKNMSDNEDLFRRDYASGSPSLIKYMPTIDKETGELNFDNIFGDNPPEGIKEFKETIDKVNENLTEQEYDNTVPRRAPDLDNIKGHSR